MGLLHPDKVSALKLAVGGGHRSSRLATHPRTPKNQTSQGSSLIEQLAAQIYHDHVSQSGQIPTPPLPAHTRPPGAPAPSSGGGAPAQGMSTGKPVGANVGSNITGPSVGTFHAGGQTVMTPLPIHETKGYKSSSSGNSANAAIAKSKLGKAKSKSKSK